MRPGSARSKAATAAPIMLAVDLSVYNIREVPSYYAIIDRVGGDELGIHVGIGTVFRG
jgi:hypothetical protein